jgi:hypothetical protein
MVWVKRGQATPTPKPHPPTPAKPISNSAKRRKPFSQASRRSLLSPACVFVFPQGNPNGSVQRESAIQRVRVSRAAWRWLGCATFSRVGASAPRKAVQPAVATAAGVRNGEQVPRPLQPAGVVVPDACTVWASMVIEMEGSQRSSSDGGTGAMLAGPGDPMNERAPSARERPRRRCACTWGRGSYVGVHNGHELRAAGWQRARVRGRVGYGVRWVCVWYGVRDAAARMHMTGKNGPPVRVRSSFPLWKEEGGSWEVEKNFLSLHPFFESRFLLCGGRF